ncbi:MAG TPA: hypothetical protein PKI11_10645 [Candidatus Hydrogenedentes bacterium]|nr:hypothetical protein [Candidatus Hydrogenedentota bacterium]HNT86786.1 hypothetical protein [Candidatus Hydrogenedentota bacterium]
MSIVNGAKVNEHRCCVVLAMLGILCSVATSGEPPIIYPPETVWPGDPDIEQSTDVRLKELYLDTVVGLRRMEEGVRLGRHSWSTYLAWVNAPKPAGDATYVIEAGRRALAKSPPDWLSYRVVLWAAKAGMTRDCRVVSLARLAFQAPRGEKLGDEHAQALIETYELLGWIHLAETVRLLEECMTEEFWGAAPVRSPKWSTSVWEGRIQVRLRAISVLGHLPPSLSLPLLERLHRRYPANPERTRWAQDEEYTFEDVAGHMFAEIVARKRREPEVPPGAHYHYQLWWRDAVMRNDAERVDAATP